MSGPIQPFYRKNMDGYLPKGVIQTLSTAVVFAQKLSDPEDRRGKERETGMKENDASIRQV